MPLFNKSQKKRYKKPMKLKIKPFNYHPKIILAWAKAIEGNEELLNYLNENEFKELVMATYAIQLKDQAREWLMDNGYPHVMAMINAAEGNPEALNWLKKNKFELFYNMALAIDGDNNGFIWIKHNASPDIYILTTAIKQVKDEIEDFNNDIHKRSTD